jgi:hypothetical protein
MAVQLKRLVEFLPAVADIRREVVAPGFVVEQKGDPLPSAGRQPYYAGALLAEVHSIVLLLEISDLATSGDSGSPWRDTSCSYRRIHSLIQQTRG